MGRRSPASSVVGRGVADGYLPDEEIARIAREGLARLPVDGRRVLVLIPDGTRTMPMPLMFDILERELGPRVARARLPRRARHALADERRAAVDALSAGRSSTAVAGGAPHLQPPLGRPGDVRRRSATIPAREIASSRGGRLNEDVPVALNRLRHRVRPRAHLRAGVSARGRRASRAARSTCSPASPRRRSSTSRTGSARSITSYEVIGTHGHAGARRHRSRGGAARHAAVAARARRHARRRRRHVLRRRRTRPGARRPRSRRGVTSSGSTSRSIGCSRSCRRCTTTCGRRPRARTRPSRRSPTAAKCDLRAARQRGQLRARQAASTRSAITAATTSWRSGSASSTILAASWRTRRTCKGLGTYDAATGVETPRIRVTLATGIPRERCERINLGYLDPATRRSARDWPRADPRMAGRAARGRDAVSSGQPPTWGE